MTETPKPRSRWRALAWVLLALLAFTGLCLTGLAIDDDPPDDADLMAPAPAIAESENAYAELAGLARRFVPPDQAILDIEENWWEPKPFPAADLAPYIATNEAVFDRVVALMQEGKRYQSPPSGHEEGVLETLNTLRLWLAHRSRMRALEGRSEAAIEDAFAVLILGARMEEKARGVLEWLIAYSFRSLGIQSVIVALRYSELDDEELTRLDERLAPYEAEAFDSLVEAVRSDYHIALQLSPKRWSDLNASIDEIKSRRLRSLVGTPLDIFLFKPNRCRSIVATATRRQMAFLRGGPTFAVLEERGLLGELGTGNMLGRDLLRVSVPDPDMVSSLKRRHRQARIDISALRTVVAIRRFQLARGRAPKALAELSPRFFKSAPKDQDGQPLRYRPDFSLVYSIGEDGEDNIAATGDADDYGDRRFSFARRKRP